MRYFRIFLLHFQNLLAHRGRSIVWLFIALVEALIYLAFIRGVFQEHSSLSHWTLPSVSAYYFLLVATAATLMTHIEVKILHDDIELGQIDGRLLKPFSYYWQNFYFEIPYRFFQGVLGILLCVGLSMVFGVTIFSPLSMFQIGLCCLIFLLAYFISFTFKMIVGILSFITTDIRGLNELLTILIIIFAGYILPINLLPGILESIAYALPFAYIIYYPIVALLGQLSVPMMLQVIGIQIAWLVGFAFVYKIVWRSVLRQFASVGQ